MIILDTHIWVWWTDENSKLLSRDLDLLRARESEGLGVSSFSIWEIAKLYEKNRVEFSVPLEDWFDKALSRPNIVLLAASPRVVVDSIRLPGIFHNDPADQIIVATARIYDSPLATYDSKILEYPHVKLVR